ncbi:GIY-YIG nuclease family protein [Agrobacterium tumefaciens]|uniref:GIY-YIG nuclease family protein n=1 Tax=Agrobacterium tumefaciens TaxID=358 RepID=UPI003BA0A286
MNKGEWIAASNAELRSVACGFSRASAAMDESRLKPHDSDSSYTYIAALNDKTGFKIGKTYEPVRRLRELSREYDFNLEDSYIVQFSRIHDGGIAEKILHRLCSGHRIIKGHSREYFSWDAYGYVLYLCDRAAWGFKSPTLITDFGTCKVRGFYRAADVIFSRPILPVKYIDGTRFLALNQHLQND